MSNLTNLEIIENHAHYCPDEDNCKHTEEEILANFPEYRNTIENAVLDEEDEDKVKEIAISQGAFPDENI